MAIIDVTENWQGLAGGDNVTSGEHRREFIVTFDDADEPANRPLIALASPQIPQGLSVHPYNNWLFVIARDYHLKGPFVIVVSVIYGARPVESIEWPTAANPLQTPWEIEYFGIDFEEIIDTAFNNEGQCVVPIVNANDEPPDPYPTETFSHLAIRITRYEQTFSENLAYQYRNAVNSDYFRGYPPWTAKISKFDGIRVIGASGSVCWRVTYEMILNFFGWQRNFLHQGYRVSSWVGSERHIDNALDDSGQPVSQPVLLTQNGARLMPGEPKTWLTFKTCKALPFAALNLNF